MKDSNYTIFCAISRISDAFIPNNPVSVANVDNECISGKPETVAIAQADKIVKYNPCACLYKRELLSSQF